MLKYKIHFKDDTIVEVFAEDVGFPRDGFYMFTRYVDGSDVTAAIIPEAEVKLITSEQVEEEKY